MKIKKAFTLAEILIVLTVIGVIAAITVPTMTKGIDESAYKASYKKAYSVISNVAGVLKADDNLPTAASTAAMVDFFNTMANSVSVQEIVLSSGNNGHAINAATKYVGTNNYTYVTFGGVQIGDTSGGTVANAGNVAPAIGTFSPWIVTEDGIAYTLTAINNATCGTKAAINNAATNAAARTATCLVVLVDTNGLNKLPNTIEAQSTNGFANANTRMGTLRGDRYYIYIGRDGVAKGNKASTFSGRLLGDIK